PGVREGVREGRPRAAAALRTENAIPGLGPGPDEALTRTKQHKPGLARPEEQSGRWGPYRQASPPPARHRPGARSARRPRCLSLLSQTEGDFTMALLKQRSLRVEALEDRCLLSANVVLEWNQLALHAVGQAKVTPVVASRALAI